MTSPPATLRTGHPAAPSMRAVLPAVLLAVLLGACEVKPTEGGPTAARVDGEEIGVAMINAVLAPRNLRPEQADAAGRQVLERLIEQQLALRKAREGALEKEPRVQLQLEAARRDVLARAYLEQVGERAARPTVDEIRRYYDEKPALFAERRIYNLQEIGIEARPEQVPELRERLAASRNIAEFVEHLRSAGLRFAGTQVLRAAEQLPLTSLDAISRLRDGQALLVGAASGVQVVVLLGSSPQPLTLEQARPRIEQFIYNDRRRKVIEDELAALRKAAKIEYLGPFADGPRPGAASAPADAASR